MFALAWLLLQGKTGRSFRAVRDSQLAAASSGVNLATYKTLAFGISAFYAGVAGSLLAIATTFVQPRHVPITLSIFLLVGVVVGGSAHRRSSSGRSSSSSCRSGRRRSRRRRALPAVVYGRS